MRSPHDILELTLVLAATLPGDTARCLPRERHVIARNLAALVGVTLLSSYLAVQLQTSASQVGNLRALNEDIVRPLSAGLITVDRDDRIRYFNPAAREILQLEDSLIGTPLASVLPGPAAGARSACRSMPSTRSPMVG